MLAIGFDQIEKYFFRQNTVAGGAGSEKQHGIFFAYGIRLFDVTEKVFRVGELRLEFLAQLFAYFITTAVNTGADGGLNIARRSAEVAAHFSQTFFDDALERSAPACMKHSDRMTLSIDQNNRQAVGGLNAENQAGSRRDQSIACERNVRRRIDEVDDVGVYLAQGNEPRQFRTVFRAADIQRPQKCRPILFDGGFGIFFREAEVEGLSTVGA